MVDTKYEISMFYARDVRALCPKCNQWLDGWMGNPCGSETICEHCGAEIVVNQDADVEFE